MPMEHTRIGSRLALLVCVAAVIMHLAGCANTGSNDSGHLRKLRTNGLKQIAQELWTKQIQENTKLGGMTCHYVAFDGYDRPEYFLWGPVLTRGKLSSNESSARCTYCISTTLEAAGTTDNAVMAEMVTHDNQVEYSVHYLSWNRELAKWNVMLSVEHAPVEEAPYTEGSKVSGRVRVR